MTQNLSVSDSFLITTIGINSLGPEAVASHYSLYRKTTYIFIKRLKNAFVNGYSDRIRL